jgi:hypothetical protein
MIEQEIGAYLAQAYCTKENEHKVVDPTLIKAMAHIIAQRYIPKSELPGVEEIEQICNEVLTKWTTSHNILLDKKLAQAIHRRLNIDIKRGNCEICDIPNAHAHHEDYSKPFEVRWLCRKHHRELHQSCR